MTEEDNKIFHSLATSCAKRMLEASTGCLSIKGIPLDAQGKIIMAGLYQCLAVAIMTHTNYLSMN